MPLPVVPLTTMVRLVWVSANAPDVAVNTLFFQALSGTPSTATILSAVDASVTANMWDSVHSSAGVTHIIGTRLDGISASVEQSVSGAKWTGGAGTGDLIPQGAHVVTLRTGNRGRSYRGRVYLPYVAEGSQNGGIISSGQVTNVQSGWTTFLATMTAANLGLSVCSRKHELATLVNSVTSRASLYTQRRRGRR